MATKTTRMSHPGLLLKEELDERGVTPHALAQALRVPATRIQAIVQGKRTITADTSARLGQYMGTSPGYWLRLQVAYDVRGLDQKRIKAEVIPAPAVATP